MLSHAVWISVHRSLISVGAKTTKSLKCLIGWLLGECGGYTIVWKFPECSSKHFWATWVTDDIVHYPIGIAHCCWSPWNQWIGGNGQEAVQHKGHWSMTFMQTNRSTQHHCGTTNYQPSLKTWIHSLMGCASHPNFTVRPKQTPLLIQPLHILLVLQGSINDIMSPCEELHLIVLTGSPWWIFCSYIPWKLKNTEMNCWIYIWYWSNYSDAVDVIDPRLTNKSQGSCNLTSNFSLLKVIFITK